MQIVIPSAIPFGYKLAPENDEASWAVTRNEAGDLRLERRVIPMTRIAPAIPEGMKPAPAEEEGSWIQKVDDGGEPYLEQKLVPLTAAEIVALNPVPREVTNFQARAALLVAGLFEVVDAALKAGNDPVALQAWEYANTIARDGELVNRLAAQLNLTQANLDDLFRNAGRIQA